MRKRKLAKSFLLLCCFLCVGQLSLWGQSPAQAKAYFEAGQWQEAADEAAALLERNARNADLNLIYGESLLKLGRYEQSLAPLKRALATRSAAALAHAEALIYLYRFEEVQPLLAKATRLLKSASDKERAAELERLAATGLRMLDKAERIEVIDSLVLPREALLASFGLDAELGQIESSQSLGLGLSADSLQAMAFVNATKDYAVFAQPNEAGVLDLFESYLLGGKWAERKALERVNSSANDNYPSMRADGMTLYFASQREGSLGGYDLYMSRLDPVERRYLMPTQLGMPFNSPFNDYLLAYDENAGLGFFVSDRYMPADSLVIYTFVPNEAYLPILSEDMEQKRAQASLREIARTQDPASEHEYRRLLTKFKERQSKAGQAEGQGEFRFVLHGERVYKRLQDFKNPQARARFEGLLRESKAIEQQRQELDRLRQDYAQANAAERKRIGASILRLEQELPQRERKLEAAYKALRALELGKN